MRWIRESGVWRCDGEDVLIRVGVKVEAGVQIIRLGRLLPARLGRRDDAGVGGHRSSLIPAERAELAHTFRSAFLRACWRAFSVTFSMEMEAVVRETME